MNNKYKVYLIIYLVFLSGIIACSLVLLDGYNWLNVFEVTDSETPLIGIPLIAIVVSQFSFRKNTKDICKNHKMEVRISSLTMASVIRWGILEAAVLISILMESAPKLNVLVILIFFISIFPTKKVFEDLIND